MRESICAVLVAALAVEAAHADPIPATSPPAPSPPAPGSPAGTAASPAAPATPSSPPSNWAAHAEAGLVQTRGNTDADTANLKFDVAHLMGQWKLSVGGSGLYARTANITTAQMYEGHGQTDRQLSPHTYAFVSAHYEDDEFSGFAYQESLTAGLGHDFLSSSPNKLSVQIGAGARRLRPEILIRNDAGAVTQRQPLQPLTEAVAQASVMFEHDFSGTTKITDNVIVEHGSSNTMTRNNLALQVQMSSSLALSISYEVDNNSAPPAGALPTDKITTLNFVYDLKNPNLSPTPGTTMTLPPPPPPPTAPPAPPAPAATPVEAAPK